MSRVWVQLRSIQTAQDEAGNAKRYYPGDWVAVGKQTALRWIASGEAWAPAEKIAGLLPVDAGVVIQGSKAHAAQFGNLAKELPVVTGEPRLAYSYTLIWDPRLKLPSRFVGAGFNLLEKWQLVVPLWDYDELACDTGSEEDRRQAKEILHDLRVPLYDTRLIFVKRCPETRRLFVEWRKWRETIDDERMAFLCALYTCKPLVLALPITWTQ